MLGRLPHLRGKSHYVPRDFFDNLVFQRISCIELFITFLGSEGDRAAFLSLILPDKFWRIGADQSYSLSFHSLSHRIAPFRNLDA